ncbi:hypothetical protein JQ604_32105 [Bradyrhizobium jicamae]|uniref:hypothetical protein n=1 Tax=Bradyrhizobium jicamae TaxID=280332 RepID=UPI001BA4DAD2|nr:hypothetical protein [Bradyrhizobium jicamae]MBR0756848.1 hypothetical protein [Bradyrhizobium jicamae]
MTMPVRLRKFALILHVTSSVGLLGAIAAFLVLAVTGVTSQNLQVVRAVYLAMQPIARLVIVPMALASLLTGLVQSLATPWGLFRHYWVLVKLLLTVVAVTILLLKLALIDRAAELATATILPAVDLREAGVQLAVHAGGGLLVLVVPVVLSIYKPPGLTRYGWRKQAQSR